MPAGSKNVAYVDQDSSSKPPVLHAGDVTPAVMREFEEGCIGYFENKEIEEGKQVRKILAGFKDTRVRDWISTDRARLLGLTFDDFMTEFRAAYLDDDWEETTRRELGAMAQGSDSFWDYAIRVQAKNSLLVSTSSHLDEEKLRHRIEAGMDELLARRCMHAKANKVQGLKKWLVEVKRLDDLMRAERKEFESIARAGRESNRRSNPLGEPSQRANAPAASGSRTTRPGGKTLPKLTESERQLLFDNDGCLKCRKFFAGHHSVNCPNAFPNTASYHTLTQADVDKVKLGHTARPIASVGGDLVEMEEMPLAIHLVAVVVGPTNPVTYMPVNQSSVIEGPWLALHAVLSLFTWVRSHAAR
jgi:hypothetical protein